MPRLQGGSLRVRGTRIGASEVAALLPCGHPFVTPADIFGRIVLGWTRPDRVITDIGHMLEPVVLQYAATTLGVRLRANSHTYSHPRIPLAATPDALVLDRHELVEAKVVSQWESELWKDGPPPHVRVQVQTQLMLTGRAVVHTTALLGATRWGMWPIEPDVSMWMQIEEAVIAFNEDHILTRRPPPDAPVEEVLAVNMPTDTRPATGDLLDLGEQLVDALLDAKTETDEVERLKYAILQMLADHRLRMAVSKHWTAKVQVGKTGRPYLGFYPRGAGARPVSREPKEGISVTREAPGAYMGPQQEGEAAP